MTERDPRLLNIRDLGTGPPITNRRGHASAVRLGTWPDDVRRIDRRSPWGNPFRIGAWHPEVTYSVKMTRDHVLILYRAWLTARLETEPDFLEPLRGKRLACWCTPLPCHGEIILELLDR